MKKIIILYFLGALLLSGCMRDEFDTTRVEEGIAARVSLRVLLPDMDGAVSAGNTRTSANTRAVDAAVENRLDSLRVLVFNSSGQIVTNRKYTAQSDGSLSSLQIDTWSGNNLTFCFVANSRDDLDNRLAVVTSYNDLREFMVTASSLNFGLSDTEALIMTAIVENVNVQPGSDTISDPIQLQFLAAKLTLTVTDATPDGHTVTILGWDVQDVPARSYLFPDSKDANPAPEGGADKEEYWLTTASDYPFEVVRNKSASQTLYLFENRRGERVARSLPGNPDERYPDMALDDTDHCGKAWFKPQRATAVVINAIHRAGTQSELIKAYIYLGHDNHSDYNIIRGNHYTFNITVHGINDIKIDTNVDSKAGDFFVDYSDNLRMDAHPDFRALRMHAAGGTGTMEILDSQGRTYADPSFDATWLKISPLNLMYHQVKQQAPNDEWQQASNPESKLVRPKYIPHKSVREKLTQQGIDGWNAIPAGQEDDDVMSLTDATYRMCYKITDLPFGNTSTVANHTLYVYADEFVVRDGSRSATVRFSFYKDGGDPNQPEVRNFTISQDGYLSFYTDDDNPYAGLNILNQDGTPSDVKQRMVLERYPEYRMTMNPGIDPSVQNINSMQWGFAYYKVYVTNNYDKFRNGRFVTTESVYQDLTRVDNEPGNFGVNPDSYRKMFGNGLDGNLAAIPAYTGRTTGAPYYLPEPTARIYHPIYKTSAARYCHEKNRDLNGNGILEPSEIHWYMPSQKELLLMAISLPQSEYQFAGYNALMSSTELEERNMSHVTVGVRDSYPFAYSNSQPKESQTFAVRCCRVLR
ncbi:MAG: fimbrial protein [Bacteroides stercoris]